MERLKNIKLLALDVDGVLTDGDMVYIEDAGLVKTFNAQDGLGIRLAMAAGLTVAWITGNVSSAVARRAKDVGVVDVYQGARCKTEALLDLAKRHGLSTDEIAYVGDDLNDLPAIELAGVAFAVSNAVPEVKEATDFTTQNPGGAGAVREVVETILKGQGKWREAVASFLKALEREQAEGDTAKVVG